MSADWNPYYDRKGRQIDMMEWGRLHSDLDYLRVAQHWVRGWAVSTVWLGIDHSFTWPRQGPPVIFETMIFAPGDVTISGDDDLDQYQERYATEEAAQAGHDRALAAMVAKLGGPAAAMEVMSAAQFSDPAAVPDDPGELT